MRCSSHDFLHILTKNKEQKWPNMGSCVVTS